MVSDLLLTTYYLLLTTYYLRPTIILLGVAEFRAAMHVRSSFSVGTALDKLVNKQVLDKVTLNSRVLPRNGLSQTGEGQSDLARSQNDPN